MDELLAHVHSGVGPCAGNVQAQAVSVRQALAARVAIVADSATANDDDDNEGVEGGAGDKRSPRAPTARLTAEELRSALGVRRCEGSPLFPECVLPMRASGGARACFLCAPPRGGWGQQSASSWGGVWSLVDEVAALGREHEVLAGLARVAEEGGSGDAVVRLVHVLQHGWLAETPQHRRVVAALGRGAMRQLRATVSASVAAASPWARRAAASRWARRAAAARSSRTLTPRRNLPAAAGINGGP